MIQNSSPAVRAWGLKRPDPKCCAFNFLALLHENLLYKMCLCPIHPPRWLFKWSFFVNWEKKKEGWEEREEREVG